MKYLEKEGEIYLQNDNLEVQAYIRYQLRDNTYYAVSTFVDPQLRGGRIAYNLVKLLSEKARSENKLIVPVCPYVVELFKRDKSFSDVWKRQ